MKDNGEIRYELTDVQFERFEKILDDVCVKEKMISLKSC